MTVDCNLEQLPEVATVHRSKLSNPIPLAFAAGKKFASLTDPQILIVDFGTHFAPQLDSGASDTVPTGSFAPFAIMNALVAFPQLLPHLSGEARELRGDYRCLAVTTQRKLLSPPIECTSVPVSTCLALSPLCTALIAELVPAFAVSE
jgi:hypothetical protein